MENFNQTTVTYRGEEVTGLAAKPSYKRINELPTIPSGYMPNGKQIINGKLCITFIRTSDYQSPIKRVLKENEIMLTSSMSNFDLDTKLNELAKITKECYIKDSSDSHLDWLLNFAYNRFGLNNFKNEAKNIVISNWSK